MMKKLDDILSSLDESELELLARKLRRLNYGKPKSDAEWYGETMFAFHEIAYAKEPQFKYKQIDDPEYRLFKITTDINDWVWYFQLGNKHMTFALVRVQHPEGWVWDVANAGKKAGSLLWKDLHMLSDLTSHLMEHHPYYPWRKLWLDLFELRKA